MTKTIEPCPGTGQRWMPGMGRAICPVCHVSSWTLGVTKRSDARATRALVGSTKTVPEHQHAAERNGS